MVTKVAEPKIVRIQFDNAGRSEGIAEISFSSREDAERVAHRFDGIDLDKKPMRIAVLEPSRQERGSNNNNGQHRRGGDRRQGGSSSRGASRG